LLKHTLELDQHDALQFKRQLKSSDSRAAQELLRTDYTMRGDWKAARALLHACRVIQNENVRELKTGE
jgi:hypothetical protein